MPRTTSSPKALPQSPGGDPVEGDRADAAASDTLQRPASCQSTRSSWSRLTISDRLMRTKGGFGSWASKWRSTILPF
uniref:hypothetical protein n=1 Tax=Inquilinus sp. OTU3971 TaxID=3043855 RepID=UPI00313BBCF2